MEKFGKKISIVAAKDCDGIKARHIPHIGVFINNTINMCIFLLIFYNIFLVVKLLFIVL